MSRTVSATEARTHLGELIDEVENTGAHVIIERGGKPTAAIVPLSLIGIHQPKPLNAAARRKLMEDVQALRESIAAHRRNHPVDEFEKILEEAREDRDARPAIDGLL